MAADAGAPAMRREVSARLELRAESPARVVLALAVAAGHRDVSETLTVTDGSLELPVRELADFHGGRLHVFDMEPGRVEVRYAATVRGAAAEPADDEADAIRYLRPSRYCESDALAPTAVAEFGGLSPDELLPAVSSWVGVHLSYVPGSSLPTDGAVRTLLARRGVCRDYAHLVVAMLRALDVPARVVSVYAPGLAPMDFHAVAEARVDGRWRVVDPTTLAPRRSLVRIATGRDAADTAFLSTHGGPVELVELEVAATADELPDDDVRELVGIR